MNDTLGWQRTQEIVAQRRRQIHPRQQANRARLTRHREFEPFDRSLDVQISRLRKMIEPDPAQPRYIQTVWGVGYVFVPDGTN